MQETFFSALAQSLLRIPSDNFFLWRHTIDSRLLLSMGGGDVFGEWKGIDDGRGFGFFWTLCQKQIITFLRFLVICSRYMVDILPFDCIPLNDFSSHFICYSICKMIYIFFPLYSFKCVCVGA